MDLSNDGLDKNSGQGDQLESKTLEQDGSARDQARTIAYPPGVGWVSGRSPVSSFTSNLSVIAASAKLISGSATPCR